MFDEPESALSILSQLNMLSRIRELVELRSQFIIATHSPILMAYPEAIAVISIYLHINSGFKVSPYCVF
ncbi:MAG: hypothetical protein LBF27_33925 [Sphingobacterium sp.]|nr:hypothetical protein [Sphingobacterium sp.]